MGPSSGVEGTSRVTLSPKSGPEPTRGGPWGLCTVGRSRPGATLGASRTSFWLCPLLHCPGNMGSAQDTKPLTMLTPPTWTASPSNPAQILLSTSCLWTLPPSPECQGLSLDFLLPLPVLDTYRKPGISWLEALAKLGFSSGLVKGGTEVPRLELMAAAAMEMGAAQTQALPCRTPE